MSTENYEPAFPVVVVNKSYSAGMTLRDYFAAKALPAVYEEHFKGIRNNEYRLEPNWQLGLAMDAYRMADAMLEARKQ